MVEVIIMYDEITLDIDAGVHGTRPRLLAVALGNYSWSGTTDGTSASYSRLRISREVRVQSHEHEEQSHRPRLHLMHFRSQSPGRCGIDRTLTGRIVDR